MSHQVALLHPASAAFHDIRDEIYQPLCAFLQYDVCSGPYLRSINVILSIGCIQLAYAISRTRQQQQRRQGGQPTADPHSAALTVALMIGLLPTHFFYGFLLYTDVASLAALLLTQLLLLQRNTPAAAAAGFAAVAMRQTNAVWVTFMTGAAVLHDIQAASMTTQGRGSAEQTVGVGAEHDSVTPAGGSNHQPQSMLDELTTSLHGIWLLRGQLLRHYWTLLLVPVCFIGFVIVNKGIAVGDRAAHTPVLHLMQPLYFALFMAVAAAPVLFRPQQLRQMGQQVQAGYKQLPQWFLAVVVATFAALVMVVGKYTLVHPYLLADNRHYTFYIWRRVFGLHWLVRYLMIPAYALSCAAIYHVLSRQQSRLWCAGFLASVLVTLVPAWLVEFRYASWLWLLMSWLPYMLGSVCQVLL